MHAHCKGLFFFISSLCIAELHVHDEQAIDFVRVCVCLYMYIYVCVYRDTEMHTIYIFLESAWKAKEEVFFFLQELGY